MVPAFVIALTLALNSDVRAESDISATRDKTLVIIPFNYNGSVETEFLKDALNDMLTTRIGFSGVINPVRHKSSAPDSAFNNEYALRTGKKLKASYVLYGSLSVMGEFISIDSILLNVDEGTTEKFYLDGESSEKLVLMAGELSEYVLASITGKSSVADAGEYVGKFKKDGAEEKIKFKYPDGALVASEFSPDLDVHVKPGFRLNWKSEAIDAHVKAMVVADLDGDGTSEYCYVTEKKIVVATLSGVEFNNIFELEEGSELRNVFIDKADIDGDGRDELYVSRLNGTHAESVVIKHNGSKVTVTARGLPWFVRAVNVPGKGVRLLTQGFRLEWGFSKKVVLRSYVDGVFTEESSFAVRSRQNALSMDIGGTKGIDGTEVAAYSRKFTVSIYDLSEGEPGKGSNVAAKLGGSLNVLELGQNGDKFSSKPDKGFVTIGPRLTFNDADNDGSDELFAVYNVAGGVFGEYSSRVTEFKSGSIKVFKWDGLSMSNVLSSVKISGYISDIYVDSLSNGVIVYAVVIEGGGWSRKKPTSRIVSYSVRLLPDN